jgi:3-dehydroquinate synthase
MARVDVKLGDRSYAIIIEDGSLRTLGSRLKEMKLGGPVMLAVDSKISATHGETALRSLIDSGFAPATCELDADEHHKSLETATGLFHMMNRARLERGSTLVALGGGIVGDLAGFAAATYLRGIALVHAPSTLLAMVDASIGGKTAVNLPTADNLLLKNAIGAFWQPRLVLSDPRLLATLDRRDFRCGLAECIKHGMMITGAGCDRPGCSSGLMIASRVAIAIHNRPSLPRIAPAVSPNTTRRP